MILVNSNLGTKASASSVTTLENRLPSGFAIVYKSFTVPKQNQAVGIFDITSYIPTEARWASVCSANGTNAPIITGTFKGVDNRWKIITKEDTSGFFAVSAIYVIPK